MNINMKGNGGILFGINSMMTGGLKSAAERQERKAKSEREIAFYENQKANLKNKECSTLEEIEEKLEMLHTYEDEIAAVKASYNHEEMFHILDEAKEQGEKNAEAAKKQEPKTPEERKKELAEEALGLDEEKGVLTEVMEELTEAVEELTETVDDLAENTADVAVNGGEVASEKVQVQSAEGDIAESDMVQSQEEMIQRKETWETQEAEAIERQTGRLYKRFDARI